MHVRGGWMDGMDAPAHPSATDGRVSGLVLLLFSFVLAHFFSPLFFGRVHETLRPTLSVGRSVRP